MTVTGNTRDSGPVRSRDARGSEAGLSLAELMVAIVIIAILLAAFAAIVSSARGLLQEADAAGEALRVAEAQIETLRALPPAKRPQGRDLPPLAAADTLDRLRNGACDVTIESIEGPGAPPGLARVRVRVTWTGECGPRDLELCTMVGPPRD
jgi:prepilin-type N-terminal cleavage/methylation domain-containing protein